MIHPEQILYQQVKARRCRRNVDENALGGRVVPRLLYRHPESGETIVHEVTFVLSHISNACCWPIPARRSHRYPRLHRRRRIFGAGPKALFSMQPDEIIDQITQSGLRGRGERVFPPPHSGGVP